MRQKLRWTVFVIAIVLIGTVGYYSYSFLKFGMDIQKDPRESRFQKFYENPDLQPVYTPPEWVGSERVNILLLGGDSRGLHENEVPRSDTIMLVSIDPGQKTAHLFSILRDTYVKIPGFGMNKINAALPFGGPELAMKTVHDLTGLDIQYFVYLDFTGFIELVDAIGGIEIYVEKDMKYIDPTEDPRYHIDLKEGLQHLDGNEALQYVRFRRDAMSDYARTERQRKFIKALAQKMTTTTSLLKLPVTLNRISPYIETNMNLDVMLRLGTLLYSIGSDKITGFQLPPFELLREERIGGAAVVTVNPEPLQAYIREILENGGGETD